jgi:DnaK suppressor protein
MDSQRKAGLTALLQSKKEVLLNSSKKDMNSFINGDARKSYGTGTEDGDVSASLQMEDISIGAMKARNEIMRQIDASLLKLREGEYGICEECNEEIDEKRLQVIPFAVLCRDCQEQRELAEKIK